VGPAPRAFVARTLQVYVLDVVSPDTVIGLAGPVFDAATPPSLDAHETAKAVTALPLVGPGENVTVNGPVVAVDEPGAAFTLVGAPGEPTTSGADRADGGPSPRAFVQV
jgi:hypothetical protein